MEESCADNKWLCKKVWEKIKSYATGQGQNIGQVIKYLGDGYVKYLHKDDIEAVDINDLGGADALKDIEINPEHAPIWMSKIAAMKGTVSKDNINYTATELVKMGPVFYHGATASEFEALPEDPSLLEMLPHVANFFENINEKKVEVVYKKLKKIFDVDNSNNICLDRALAEQVSMFFTAASASDLKKFSTDTRKTIMKTLGHKYDYVKRMTRQKSQELFQSMMELDDLSTKGSYTESDVTNYGYMWCGQSSTQANKFSEDAIDGAFGKLKDCACLDHTTRKAMASRAVSVSGGLSNMMKNFPQRVEDLGNMITDIDISDFNQLDETDKQVFVSSTQKLMESVTKVQREVEKRPVSEISETERKETETRMSQFGRVLFDMHLSVSFSRRKKRSLSSPDCATIQSFNGALSFLTSSDILSLSTSEFSDCLSEFQSTAWTSSQYSAFATQLLAAFGSDCSTWTLSNVLGAGILLESLSASHILNMTVIDDNAASTLGTNIFTNNANHIVSSFLTTSNITDLSTITASTLGNTGNLVCGFNSTQIAAMDSSAIDGASTDLNSVTCLQADQLTSLANKIVEVRGTDWTAVTSGSITSLGVLAGGLPVSVLEDLGSDQLSSISSSAISNMDANTFATVFTVAKISSLSSAQANAVTSIQMAALSTDQKNAIYSIATTTSATGSDNGTPEMKMAQTTLLLLMLLAMLAPSL